MKITKPGIYLDVSAENYFADPCPMPSLTQSIAKILIEQSPAHARLEHPRLAPPGDKPREAYDADKAIGNAVHALMIGRGKDVVVAEFSDWRTKAAQEFRDDPFHAGKTVILEKHFERARAMETAARSVLLGSWFRAFTEGQGELVVAWKEDDLWFRTMIDWLDGAVCTDYKTTGMSCAPHQIGPMIEKMGWHVQAAMHERALASLKDQSYGRLHLDFRFVAQENYPPYCCTLVELDEHWMTMGRKKLQRAIDIWGDCITNDRWPGYPLAPVTPEYPGYRELAWLNREEAEFAPRYKRMLTDLAGG